MNAKVKKIFKLAMAEKEIETFKDLAKETGIDYHTLLDHLERPELFRAYELKAINEVLQFSSENLFTVVIDN